MMFGHAPRMSFSVLANSSAGEWNCDVLDDDQIKRALKGVLELQEQFHVQVEERVAAERERRRKESSAGLQLPNFGVGDYVLRSKQTIVRWSCWSTGLVLKSTSGLGSLLGDFEATPKSHAKGIAEVARDTCYCCSHQERIWYLIVIFPTSGVFFVSSLLLEFTRTTRFGGAETKYACLLSLKPSGF